MILSLSISLGLVFALSGYLVIGGVVSQNERDARLYMETLSREYANRADTILEVPLDTARALANAFSGYGSVPEDSRRPVFLTMLRSVLSSNPGLLGIWTIWEPDALEGSDRRFASRAEAGSDANGRFSPYYVWADGRVVLEIPDAEDGYSGPFYAIPKAQRQEYLSEPYLFPVQGKDVLMISTVVPILVGGRFVGAVGIDFTADYISSQLGALQLYETGFGRLISNEGLVVSHKDPERIAKKAPEWDSEERDGVMNALKSGESFTRVSYSVSLKRNTLKSFVPVFIGASKDPWMYGTVVPEEETYAQVRRLMILNMLSLVLGFILIVAIIGVLTGVLLKPLASTRLALEEIAQGEGDLTKQLVVRSRDEMGSLADSFNSFTGNLARIIGSVRSEIATLQGLGTELSQNLTQTSTAISQINGNLKNVGSSLNRQGDAVSEVSSTVEEIVGNINSLNRQIGEQGENLGAAAAAVEEIVANLGSISSNLEHNKTAVLKLQEVSETGNDKLAAVTATVSRIAEQSRGLEETNGIIKAIASQTNLLAMNAAIEAAHAGDAGRGFAVVADEIRKLAEDTAARSHEISSVLNALGDQISEGVTMSREAGKTFDSIRASVQEVSTRQMEIRSALEEQNSGNQVVLKSVADLRRIGSEVESGSREMAVGSDAILRSITTLSELTAEVQTGLQEIELGTGEIDRSMNQVSELSRRNKTGIDAVEATVERFKI